METIDQLVQEATEALAQFWFVQRLDVVERTDQTVTLQLVIDNKLRVQAFLSQRSGRLSLALIGPAGRLYGETDSAMGGTGTHSQIQKAMK